MDEKLTILNCTCGKKHWIKDGKIIADLDPYKDASFESMNSLIEVI